MATINITVQSLLNAALYDSYAVDDAGTIGELKDSIESTTDCSVEWFDLVFDNEVLDTAETIGSYGIVEGSSLRTHNKIARLETRELRQVAKLNLAALDRAASENPRAVYDITQLPTQYDGNTIVDNPNSDGDGGILLVQGRPWTEVAATPTYNVEFRAAEEGSPGDVITTINEGDVGIYMFTGTNVPEDANAYLQFSGANITSSDGGWFDPFGNTTGNVTDTISVGSLYGNIGNILNPLESPGGYISINADNLTEGNETLRLDWYIFAEIVASANLTIVDTSLDPTYTFSDIPTSIDEGIAGTFDVATTGVDDGTTLYWTIATNAGDFETTSGSFTITSNTGSFSVTPTLDGTTEGSETFTVSIRTDSISGTVVATSGSVTINDIATVPLQVSLITAPSSGTTWTDASTFGRNATLYKAGTGNFSYTASNGGGITTTGSNLSNGAIIDIPYNLPSTFTIEIVASITSTNYWASLFGNEVWSTKGYVAYWFNDTGIAIGSPSDTEMYAMASGQKANRNHYVITVTGSTLKFYINGALQTKTFGTFAQPSGGISTNSLQIGARHPNAGTINTPNDPAHGTYYRVQVWNVVKTAGEITDLYNNAKAAHNTV
jgi:hypothetical protein